MEKKQIELVPVDSDNWRSVANLSIRDDQSDFVNSGSYYLCLCNYGKLWNPLAIRYGDAVVGFMMWALDDEDGSCWLGGIIIDQVHQGKGIGEASVREAIKMLSTSQGCRKFALSYEPSNTRAKRTYAKVGFAETGEKEDDELVAKFTLS